MSIRFENLPQLLNDMRSKRWTIDAFNFQYNNERYIVILKLYGDNETKPSKYAQAKIEFLRYNNTNVSINAYIDFFEVHFNSTWEFCGFFGVQNNNANRNLFVDFSNVFKNCIPNSKIFNKPNVYNVEMSKRLDGNNPNAIYCYDIHRNGTFSDGRPHQRTVENSNKAFLICPIAYEKFKDDWNLSFYFSDDPQKQLSDKELIQKVSNK